VTVGIQVGQIVDEIGSESFFHAFFSTVSVHCESDGWGSRYPSLMNGLYQGEVTVAEAATALLELRNAKTVLLAIAPTGVVWDIENREAMPPWGSQISSEVTSLGNYFVSSTGRDLFELLDEALSAAVQEKTHATIV
jgi:hypothetical protein